MSQDKRITKIYLCTVPLENDYKHTLHFEDEISQLDYFLTRQVFELEEFTYQRKDNSIRVPIHFDNVYNCNYVVYQNPYGNYSNKWFYAFITDMEYVNDNCTLIHIETDVMQTWYFEHFVKASFVEREHVNNDTLGLHTVPEGLETGEYTCGKHNYTELCKVSNLSIIVGVTSDIAGWDEGGRFYSGLYSGIGYYCFDYNTEGIKALNNWLHKYDEEGRGDAIICMFLAPKFLIKYDYTNGNRVPSSDTTASKFINYSDVADTLNTNMSLTRNTLDGYAPRNQKLMTYPYRYLLASNNNGGSAVYKYELFSSSSGDVTTFLPPTFRIDGCITPGCSIRLVPMYYNGVFQNHEEGLNFGKFPILNWTSDIYTNWLTQNNLNIGIQLGSAAIQVVGGVAAAVGTGGIGAVAGGGAVVSGVSQAINTLAQVHQQSLTPPQSKGNVNCGDVIALSGLNDIWFYEMTIKKEYAEILDKFFDVYGYKVNMVKVPNKEHRSRYWYTKTIDVNIDGNIPNKDMQKIKDCYNNGITFWRNADEIQNYSLTNNIV